MSETNTENGKVDKVEVEEAGSVDTKDSVVDKTFTQEELDKIVANRVGREAEKVATLSENLKKMEAKAMGSVERVAELELELSSYSEKVAVLEREKVKNAVAFESGVDPSMLEYLKWDNEDELRSAVDKWKSSVTSSNDSVFKGKDYSDNDSPVRFAKNVARKYQ